jgi:hypothetical protein
LALFNTFDMVFTAWPYSTPSTFDTLLLDGSTPAFASTAEVQNAAATKDMHRDQAGVCFYSMPLTVVVLSK